MSRINHHVESLIARRLSNHRRHVGGQFCQRPSTELRIHVEPRGPAAPMASQILGPDQAASRPEALQEVSALRVTLENTSAAQSAICDAAFAAETSGLSRAQILVNRRGPSSLPTSAFQLPTSSEV